MDKGALDVCWDALNQAKRDQSRVQGEVKGGRSRESRIKPEALPKTVKWPTKLWSSWVWWMTVAVDNQAEQIMTQLKMRASRDWWLRVKPGIAIVTRTVARTQAPRQSNRMHNRRPLGWLCFLCFTLLLPLSLFRYLRSYLSSLKSSTLLGQQARRDTSITLSSRCRPAPPVRRRCTASRSWALALNWIPVSGKLRHWKAPPNG